jgi:hypothetical protein
MRGSGDSRADQIMKTNGEYMKTQVLIVSVLLLLLSISAVSAAQTVTATSPLDAAALVYVSGYECSPAVFYPDETGTVTVHVTNSANASVLVSQPNLIDPHLKIINQGDFATSTTIGPGATIDYNFLVNAEGNDGTYFPLFTVSTNVYGAHAINSQIKLKIDSTDVRGSISARPDTFAISKKDTVNVSIVNARAGDITNVLIVPDGGGADITPDETFVGTLKAGSSVQVPFSITPERASDVTFHVSFNNGDNKHTTDVVLPLTLGENKKGAQIVVNNIASSGSGNVNTLKGDVTNNGLTDAQSVLVTVGSPATPVNPNPVYAIGNLEPDDFSSFEVTYTSPGQGAIPLLVEFKDSDGTVYKKTFSITANANTGIPGSAGVAGAAAGAAQGSSVNRRGGIFGSFGSGLGQIPVTEIVVCLIIIIALLVAWRKGLLKRLADKFRKNRDNDIMPEEP